MIERVTTRLGRASYDLMQFASCGRAFEAMMKDSMKVHVYREKLASRENDVSFNGD